MTVTLLCMRTDGQGKVSPALSSGTLRQERHKMLCYSWAFAVRHTPSLCRCLRIPISDMEEEDIGCYFDEARSFIDSAAAAGGAVLVHCHEGKSRSATLVLAYFMKTKVAAVRQGCCKNFELSRLWHL
jgi:hypothetical protein